MKKKRFSLIGICLLVFLLLSVSACQDNSGVESTRSVSPKPVSSQTPGGQTQTPSWIVTGAPKETPTIDLGHVQTFDIPTDDPIDETPTSAVTSGVIADPTATADGVATSSASPTATADGVATSSASPTATATPTQKPTQTPSPSTSTPIVLPPVWFD